MTEVVHIGWAVAVTAHRDLPDGCDYRTRAYAVGTFSEEDAIEYAYTETEKIYSVLLGWDFQVATVRLTQSVEVKL